MSLSPFSFLNFLSLSSFRGLNWFEGLKRIKVFLQWLWGAPSGLVLVFVAFHVKVIDLLVLFLVAALPILGFELLFRAVVWIVAGFLQSGDSKAGAGKPAQAHQLDDFKKKVTYRLQSWIIGLKKKRPHHVRLAVFLPLWFYIWYLLVTQTSFCPVSHWKNSGFAYPLENIDFINLLRLLWYVILTFMRVLLAVMVLFFVPHLYNSIEQGLIVSRGQDRQN
jgi:hypothetical protein